MPPDTDSSEPSIDEKYIRDLPPRLRPWVKLVGAGGLASLGGFVVNFWAQLSKPETRLRILIGAFVALAFAVLSREPRSTFRKRWALKIGLRYLVDREEAVGDLVKQLRNAAIVFLTSESGAGKTTLLKKDLTKELKSRGTFFPIYLDHWGEDWAEGPRQTLAASLSEPDGSAWRKGLGVTAPVRPEQALAIVGRFYDELGKLPVLLFDQFDDYYLQHRSQFIRGSVLKPNQLMQENRFWDELAQLISAGKASCLFAVRDEVHPALDSFRFPDAKTDSYLLERLPASFAGELLEKVASKAGLRHPKAGFDTLSERLIADLGGEDGLVLPAQVKLAFLGLEWLDPLTVRSYIRAGGLRGLEALALEHQIARAARKVTCQPAEFRPLLLALVDPKTGTDRPRTDQELLQLLPEGKRDAAKLADALRLLRDADIVRLQSDAPEVNEVRWQLDHPYLRQSLAKIDERARRWQVVLDAAAQTFKAAPNLLGRWFALLRPGAQVRVAYERLKRRVSYGSARRFAVLSTLRLLFNPLVIALVIALFSYQALGLEPIAWDDADRHADDPHGEAVCWLTKTGALASGAPADSFITISVGTSHACGVTRDKALAVCWSWGSNEFRQADPPPGSYLQVNTGAFNTCGLKTDESVTCWGDNRYQQSPVSPAGEYTLVSAGQVHSCGVTTGGSIDCWGGHMLPAPAGRYVQVSAAINGNGDPRSCAVERDGHVVCWDNHPGHVVHPPGNDASYHAVSTAGTHSCAIGNDHKAVCWDGEGQPLFSPRSRFKGISTGGEVSCGVTKDDSILCWDIHGTLVKPKLPPGSYFHVAAGPERSCALKRGREPGVKQRVPP